MAADRRRLAGKRGSAAGPSGPAAEGGRDCQPLPMEGPPGHARLPTTFARQRNGLKNLERGTNKVLAKTWGVRWGPDASSDVLRRSARCNKSGRKGAVLQHPSWAGMHIGFEPFPVNSA